MEEQEAINSVDSKVAPDANANHEPEQKAQPEVEAKAEDKQEYNWREMRRQKTELEKKVKMQEEMMERLMKYQAPTPQAVEIDEFDQIDDTEVLQKGHTKRLVQKEAQRIAKEIVQQEMGHVIQRQEQNANLQRLHTQFPDFKEVVNQESLALLEEQEPELASAIAESKDPYKVLYQSYKFIKKLGIAEKSPTSRHQREVEAKIEKNAKTVQSPQAHDKRPMAQAFRMTEGMRKDLADEMNMYARQASSVPELR